MIFVTFSLVISLVAGALGMTEVQIMLIMRVKDLVLNTMNTKCAEKMAEKGVK